MPEVVKGRDSAQTGTGLRRHWWPIVLGIVVGLLGGLLITQVQTPRYTSEASVLVLPTDSTSAAAAGARTATPVNLATESELVGSAQVAGAVQTLLRTSETVPSLLEKITVTVPPNSQVLDIAYVDRTAQGAQAGARAFAQAYLTFRSAEAKKDIDSRAVALRSQLKNAQAALQAASDKAAALVANSPERVYAEAQRNIQINQISNLNNSLTELTASSVTAGQVITDAALPSSPSFPIPALNLGAGLVAGLLLGLAAAMLLDRRSQRDASRSQQPPSRREGHEGSQPAQGDLQEVRPRRETGTEVPVGAGRRVAGSNEPS